MLALSLRASVGELRSGSIAVFPFGVNTIQKPIEVAACVYSNLAWQFSTHSGTDLFWMRWYTRPTDPPDFMGGRSRRRIEHAKVIADAASSVDTAYEFPHDAAMVISNETMLRSSAGRYSLLFTTQPLKSESDKQALMYVRDIRGRDLQPVKIAESHINCTRVTLALPDGSIEVLWMEDVPSSEDLPLPIPSRLMECHFRDEKWSQPRCLGQHAAWRYDSLAATVVAGPQGSSDVLAVWRGARDELVYTLGDSDDRWIEPMVVPLKIGDTNWLASDSGVVWLVTRLNRNLYWCSLPVQKLVPRETSTKPGEEHEQASDP